ncbi:hypothetical protein FB446DRAFT_793493 [Lentinula raphanica]|nr:hypothetical protein FB446DRAFT_793493 [Lentinula raphanica]
MSSVEEIQSISHIIREAYTSVASLDLPSLDSSPRTHTAFNNMLRVAQQASGQILSLVVGMSQSATDADGQSLNLHTGTDNLLDDTPATPGPDNPPASSEPEDNTPDLDQQIQEDIEQLLSEANNNELWFGLCDFRYMIEQGGYSDSTAQKEKEAFCRMLVGYRCIPTNMIVEEFMLHDLQLATLSIACHAQHVSVFQRLPNSNQRLFEHEKLLYYPPNSSTVHAWVHAVINNIQAIEFVKDWLEESAEWKKNFQHALATHFYRDEYHWIELSIFPSKKKDKLHRQLYTRFCKKHDKVIVQWKQILQFYELFGPTILLDPIWLLLTKQGYSRQSKL